MNRRDFLATLGAASGAVAAGQFAINDRPTAGKLPRVTDLEQPVAIAMWDFSWLLRHHPAGEFEDWSRVLDELVERGYNAVRIDVFPNLVAAGSDGGATEEYFFPKNDWRPAMWGNQFSVRVRPREALLEFLPKCAERGVHVGMSSWFFGPGAESIEGLDGFVRVWDQTLSFLNDHGLLDNVFYVDLLNEYPMFHGFKWLETELNRIRENEAASTKEREAHQFDKDQGQYNAAQRAFYGRFISEAIDRLKAKWPELPFFACQTDVSSVPWQDMDFSRFEVLDVHRWFILHESLSSGTGYWENLHDLADNDLKFAEVNAKLRVNWDAHRDALIAWMAEFTAAVAARGRALGIPYGNTEGWGIINWLDHPALGWEIMKDAAEICAHLGREHGYAFNCTSNFTHPQFPRLWNDVEWHRRVTSIIRYGG